MLSALDKLLVFLVNIREDVLRWKRRDNIARILLCELKNKPFEIAVSKQRSKFAR